MEQIRKTIFILMIFMVMGFCLYLNHIGPVLHQEGNPIAFLVSTLKLKLSSSEYVLLAKTEKRRRYLSQIKGNREYEVVKDFMISKGWEYKEQMGSGLIFSKNGEDAVVEVRQYSNDYFIWEIQKAFFN
ncbi:hypothetical protein G4Z05_13185 [Bacillus thermocopriae]|uniref:Uncharacterized protein n=1 Tax=Neobacillus thermocopriae TaxID=1215031 RepID=A0A6B3TUY6_9BACI|nr:hypothetical protein [Neobacillus thermocopriae]MED3623573.1 hypothetical protein [Neobacillus thermocopriae]MED3714473.1 hypothetical protein [Neobacillus thermocopriae]NEX79811.1 hypothetical protein [Neobacillus thermocopriae]